MGANCCTPTKHKTQLHGTSSQFSTHRNATYSPSWSLRWDNRTHIEDFGVDSRGNMRHVGGEMKRRMDADADGLSDVGSTLDSSETPKWGKMPLYRDENDNQKVNVEEERSTGGSFSFEGRNMKVVDSNKEEPSTSRGPSSSINPTNSYSFFMKPSNEDNVSVPSICSNDLSSDGWSMRMFSELVASSQRGRCSFDSDSISSSQSKIIHHSLSSSDPDTCVICSKLLRERSPWSTRKIVSGGTGSSSIIAVLACGHAYHAECLESETASADKYDPPCPICVGGEKSEARERNKMSMSAITDLCSDTYLPKERQKTSALGSTSGLKNFGRPFLKRHFSTGSRSAEASILAVEQTRKKGFWGRNREVS